MIEVNSRAPTNEKVYTSKSAPLVNKIRERFFNEQWPKYSEFYCEEDIKRVRESEWFVKRFLLAANRNVDQAFEMLMAALKWRKEQDIPNLKADTFPKEFYEIGGLFSYETDRQNNPVIYLRIRMHKKIPELEEFVKKFLFYTINRADLECKSNGCVIIFDCNGAGYSNMDMELLKNLVDVAFKYFPYCVQYIIVYELSWLLDTFRRIAMTFIPASLSKVVRFANKNNITEFIAEDHLPDFMGGTCKQNYRKVPDNCRPVMELAPQYGFTTDDVIRIMAHFEPFLIEARKAILQWQTENNNENKKELKNNLNEIPFKEDNYLNEEVSEDGNELVELNDNSSMTMTRCGKNGINCVAIVNPSTAATTMLNDAIHCKSFANVAAIYPQNKIYFHRITSANNDGIGLKPEKEIILLTSLILIRNRGNDNGRSLAFKIKSNCSDRYLVTPHQGVLLPKATIKIRLTGINPTNINNQNNIQDKFFILMCSVENISVHLKNMKQFNKLFEPNNIDKIYTHKLTVMIDDNSNDNDNNNGGWIGNKTGPTSPYKDQILLLKKFKLKENFRNEKKNELKLMKDNFERLRLEQRKLKIILMIIILLMLITIIMIILINPFIGTKIFPFQNQFRRHE